MWRIMLVVWGMVSAGCSGRWDRLSGGRFNDVIGWSCWTQHHGKRKRGVRRASGALDGQGVHVWIIILYSTTYFSPMMATTRLRKTFHYPADNSDEDDTPLELDEEGKFTRISLRFSLTKMVKSRKSLLKSCARRTKKRTPSIW